MILHEESICAFEFSKPAELNGALPVDGAEEEDAPGDVLQRHVRKLLCAN